MVETYATWTVVVSFSGGPVDPEKAVRALGMILDACSEAGLEVVSARAVSGPTLIVFVTFDDLASSEIFAKQVLGAEHAYERYVKLVTRKN